MEADVAFRYWEAITVIEAQDLLLQMRIADWPNMKKQDRARFHKQIHKMAYPKTYDDRTKQVSTKEFTEKLRLLAGG